MITAAMIKLQLAGNTAFGFVGGAGDFASAQDSLKVSKSLFVMPPSSAAEPNTTGTQVVRQRVKQRFRIVAGFSVRSAAKEDVSGDVDTVRDALIAALVGWKPEDLSEPTNLVGWQPILAAKDGVTVFYAGDFTTTTYLRSIP